MPAMKRKKMNSNFRCYSELITLPTFKKRFNYLKLNGAVGESTFGFDRYINQKFYRTSEWKNIRRQIILRDFGCDLACIDREIPQGVRIIIHHMNPMDVNDIIHKQDWILDPEFLICTTKRTHDAIHYGDESILYDEPISRFPGDTCLWK